MGQSISRNTRGATLPPTQLTLNAGLLRAWVAVKRNGWRKVIAWEEARRTNPTRRKPVSPFDSNILAEMVYESAKFTCLATQGAKDTFFLKSSGLTQHPMRQPLLRPVPYQVPRSRPTMKNPLFRFFMWATNLTRQTVRGKENLLCES